MKIFTRRIRQIKFSEKLFNNYLIYATGEIFLIVLGILIALQINNWNTDRQNRQKEIVYLNEIKSNLQYDLENEIIPAIEDFNYRLKANSILQSIFFNEEGKISHDSIIRLTIIAAISWDMHLNYSVFENLKSVGIDVIKNDSLRFRISNLYGYYYSYLLNQQKMAEKVFIEQMEPAWHDVIETRDQHKTPDELEVIRSSKRLKTLFNLIAVHNRNLLILLEELKPRVEAIIAEIETELKHLE